MIDRNRERRARNNAGLHARLKAHEGLDEKCSVFGCDNPTGRSEGASLDANLCRNHKALKARHGSTWARTPSGKDYAPYIKAARSIIKRHRNDPQVRTGLASIEWLLATAPTRPELVKDLRFASGPEKARQLFARLRERNIGSIEVLVAYLGVAAFISNSGAVPQTEEFRHVQTAKKLLRRCSGSHIHYESGHTVHQYSMSTGLYLRRVGEMLDKELSGLLDWGCGAVVAEKIRRYGGFVIGDYGDLPTDTP